MGTDFWAHLGEFMQKGLVGYGTISTKDLSLYTSTDDPAEAVAIVRAVKRKGRGAGGVRRVDPQAPCQKGPRGLSYIQALGKMPFLPLRKFTNAISGTLNAKLRTPVNKRRPRSKGSVASPAMLAPAPTPALITP